MFKARRGNTYLQRVMVDDKPYFYIVHQLGERSWVASLFSHTSNLDNEAVAVSLTGNSTNIFELVKSSNNATDTTVKRYLSELEQALMRRTMAKIFLKGEF